jgi:hypothetical protein
VKQIPIVETELDANGEAMICEGCGSTQALASILARHGPHAIACCPERKMVQARYFWSRASEAQSTAIIKELCSSLVELLEPLERANAEMVAHGKTADENAEAAFDRARAALTRAQVQP